MVVQKISTAGGTLAVEVTGEGPLLICAHGMGDSRDVYDTFVKQMVSAGYCVANMDTRGHGESSTGFKQHGDLAQADDFLTVVKELKKGPAVLVGNSFATGSATIAAGRKPESIAGIVLLAPFLRNPMGAVGMFFMPLLFKWPWGSTVWRFYAPTLWPGLSKEDATARAKKTTKLITRPGRWSAFYSTVCGCDHSTVTPYIEKASKTPALIVVGDKDPDYSDPKKEAEWVASQFQDATTLVLEGVGHAPQLERPEETGKATLEFLKKLKEKGVFK
ncbi:hypothetical protein LTR09_005959 [Extremus antarcticus]|uniref:AB hydrolase-1 domain-containing protein n=1 Tax=Extremus antarcticus TaxID=702011 RepID=A0AAJ0DFE8_9PEZI|nr:hypothetical protein LTR09_005959 [Extremus antarcticus]